MAETLSKATTRRCRTVFKPSRKLPLMRVRAGNCHLTLKVPRLNLLVLDGGLTDTASLAEERLGDFIRYRLRNHSTKSGSSILTFGPSFLRRSNLGSVGSNVSSGLNTRGSTGTYLYGV